MLSSSKECDSHSCCELAFAGITRWALHTAADRDHGLHLVQGLSDTGRRNGGGESPRGAAIGLLKLGMRIKLRRRNGRSQFFEPFTAILQGDTGS
jgi:hypothetical protein